MGLLWSWLQFKRKYSADGAVKKRVEDVMPIATRHERTRNTLTSPLEGDKQQLQQLYNACIGISQVLSLVAGVLLEKQVLVVCPNLGVLSAVVLSLVPLIRPFQWQSLLLPQCQGSWTTIWASLSSLIITVGLKKHHPWFTIITHNHCGPQETPSLVLRLLVQPIQPLTLSYL
ncbi:hypothetical protein SO802_017772 [Lithocarpus litseifolius]|uniref:UDENN domain-containing protein n=1 Tax=Lithocarpus litseifolius TaxID=425828 RepID=A0AAW2CIX8_9ROSI